MWAWQRVTYRRKLLHHLDVIQRKFPLLDELHARDARDHFRAAGNPEDIVHGHGLALASTDLTGGMFENRLALLVDGREHDARGAGWVGSEGIDLGLEVRNS